MILDRHLRALLKRLGIDEQSPPPLDQWLALLAQLNDRLRLFEDERHRLQRSLEIHGRELQTLYRELVNERDQLASALACIPQGFVIFDRRGAVALMSVEAEQWLDPAETTLSALQLDRSLQRDDLLTQLADGCSVTGTGYLRTRSGTSTLFDVHLLPLIRDTAMSGVVMTFAPPADSIAAPPEAGTDALSPLVTMLEHLVGHPDTAPVEERLRQLLQEAREASEVLSTLPAEEEVEPAPVEVTQEELPAVEPEPPPPPVAELPVARASAPPKPPRASRRNALRVLLVENGTHAQETTRAIVEKLGHQCTLARDATDALRLHAEEPFEAIISTYRMEGMDGIELCRKVRENAQGGYPYFILLTTVEKREDATRALEAGVDAFLTTPLDANDLAVRLKVAKGVQARLSRVYSEFAAGGEI